jgi:hypothetical protein
LDYRIDCRSRIVVGRTHGRSFGEGGQDRHIAALLRRPCRRGGFHCQLFFADSGIAGTPGAILVIASSVILIALGLIMRSARSRGLRVFVTAAALLDIAGTAFAGYLLESETLVVAMLVCLAGWFIHLIESRPRPAD